MNQKNVLIVGPTNPSAPILSKLFEFASNQKFNVSACSMNGQRTSMEDEITILPQIPNHPAFSMFAVFDGHGGTKASEFLSKEMGHSLSKLTPTEIQDNETVKKMIVNLDRSFCASARWAATRDSGSTIALTLVESTAIRSEQQKKSIFKIRAFWAGDSRAITGSFSKNVAPTPSDDQSTQQTEDEFLQFLLREHRERDFGACDPKGTIQLYNQTVSASQSFRFTTLTVDHVPDVEAERKRIEKAGSCVLANRVAGCLAVSRAFGDPHYKQMPDVPFDEQPVTSLCDVSEWQIELDEESDTHWLLLCCDGLVEHSSNIDVVTSLHNEFHANQCRIFCGTDHMPFCLGNVLVDSILDGSMDNLSAVFVEFKHFAALENDAKEDDTKVVRTFLPGPNMGNKEMGRAFSMADGRFQAKCSVFWDRKSNLERARTMEKLRAYTHFETCSTIANYYMRNSQNIKSRENRRLAVGLSDLLLESQTEIKEILTAWEDVDAGKLPDEYLTTEDELSSTDNSDDDATPVTIPVVVSPVITSTEIDDAWKFVCRENLIVAGHADGADELVIDNSAENLTAFKKRSLHEVDDVDMKEDEPCEKKRRIQIIVTNVSGGDVQG